MVKHVSRFGVSQEVLIALGLTTEHVVETACGAMMQAVAARSFFALQTREGADGWRQGTDEGCGAGGRKLGSVRARWREGGRVVARGAAARSSGLPGGAVCQLPSACCLGGLVG